LPGRQSSDIWNRNHGISQP
ncbi:mCG146542, partial [Mus musculus]